MTTTSYLDPIAYYDKNALEITARYESVTFEDVHSDLIEWLPKPGSKILDVGAGTGRDAYWLAKKGYYLTAVEPSKNLRAEGIRLHSHPHLNWVDDALPGLHRIIESNIKFDLVLLSAVLMFIPPSIQKSSLSILPKLLKSKGRVALTIRFGPPEPQRGLFSASENDLRKLLADIRMFQILSWNETKDTLGLENVRWASVVLQYL